MSTNDWRHVRERRLSLGLVAGVFLAILFAALSVPVVEWMYGTLAPPQSTYAHLSSIEYIEQVRKPMWLLAPFALLYLVPLLVVDYLGGLGRDGLVSIAG